MRSSALYCTDLAIQREIAAQSRQLSRGFWVLRAASGTVFFAATILLCFALVETFCCLRAERQTVRSYAIMGVSHSLTWAVAGLALAIPLFLSRTWFAQRRDAMIADCHSARVELLNYLARPRC